MKRACTVLATLVAWAGPAIGADLSPGHWPAAERARLEQMELSPFPAQPRLVKGGAELVSATLSPVAAHVGVEALRQGGTAADAAVAVALTQIAMSLGSVDSYAGVAELVYYDARSGKVYALDAGGAPYAGEHDPASIGGMDLRLISPGSPAAGGAASGGEGRKTLTPGFMAGMAAAHKRFGRLPFETLFQPAIWYAEQGVTVSPLLEFYFQAERQSLSRTEEGRRFLAQSGRETPSLGDRFVQPALAELLRHVAGRGAGYMYTGPWAQDFVRIVRREGGAVTAEDLAGYRPRWREPFSTRVGDATVFGPGADSTGGCATLEALNLLGAPGALRPWSDPDAFVRYAKALRFAQYGHYLPAVTAFERANGFGPDCQARLTGAYAAALAPRIDQLTSQPGQASPGHHSASVVVIDRWGNVAALVHSINSVMWGDTGIVVDGVPISGAAGISRRQLAAARPGEHLPTDMAPVIALRGGKPVLAVASVGSSLVPETVRMSAALLGGDDPRAVAAAAPLLLNFETPFDRPLTERPELAPSGAYGPDFKAAVQTRGVTLQELPPAQVAGLRGTAAFGVIGPAVGALSAEAPGVAVFGEAP